MKKFLYFFLLIFITSCSYFQDSDIANPCSEMVEESLADYTWNQQVVWCNLHTTASRGVWTKDRLLNLFYKEFGWSKPGYNIYVTRDGERHDLVEFNEDGLVQYIEASWGVRGINNISINVAWEGGVSWDLEPYDNMTNAQLQTLHQIFQEIKCKFPWIKFRGHRDHDGVTKACPSFNFDDKFGYLNRS